MNKQELKRNVIQKVNREKKTLLKIIKLFPEGYDWGDFHVDVARKKLDENPELTPEQVIDMIKRSWVCTGDNWLMDKKE
ncbi:hypothetical protein KAR91_15275 [Candidatus Pacearchaeota archaeon]|nr:hypothetical protein [Candidatus Pacearchaeota archaeon]